MIGRPFSVRFRESARLLFPELRNYAISHSQNGKADIAIDTADLPIDVAVEGQASHVVFLNRVSSTPEPFFTKAPREDAFAYFEQILFYGDEMLRAEQRATLAELLTRPVLRLTYSDPAKAERALRSLLPDGI